MDPIAITGLGFELPQGVNDDSSLWEMLQTGKNVMTEWPASRTNISSFYHHDRSSTSNLLSSKGAHFLKHDPAAFDASFFSITSKEAMSMDPQQRWLLETSYRALENAGYPAENVAGTQTGVFVGSMTDDWSRIIAKDPDEAPQNTATGSSLSILANRLSWYFDFKGPSVQVNTACSSSMVAMDLACQSLRTGQSSMALVGGSNVLLSPETSLYLSNMNFISPDGVCYSFDHRANGYGRGEGIIVLVLKRLSDAIRDGDMIRAVIRATGSNQDGYTPGLTQPSSSSQENLIRAVYKSCNLGFKETRYIEAHGTGTQIGDATEANAIGRVFRRSRSQAEPLFIGSIKSNIGHLEGGSGLAGILKSIMILEKGIIPPNPLFEKWSSKINAKSGNIQVPTTCTTWPCAGVRRISVNSFGFGGANAHIILDDAYHTFQALSMNGIHHVVPHFDTHQLQPNGIVTNGHGLNGKATTAIQWNGTENRNSDHSLTAFLRGTEGPEYRLLVCSAKDENALKRMQEQHATYIETHMSGSSQELDQMAYTLATRRSVMQWRSFFIAERDAPARLFRLTSPVTGRAPRDTGLAMVFTGQGAQYVEMGMALCQYSTFLSTLEIVDQVFHKLGADWSLFDKIKDSESINLPQFSQPLCTALQIGLVELLRAFKVIPDAVIGHSSGEIAAAYTIGALSLESACKIAYYRGQLTQQLMETARTPGAMISINLSETDANRYLAKLNLLAKVHIACINSPFNVTLSGPEEDIDILKKGLDNESIFAQILRTGVAYHSAAMKEIESEYRDSLGVLYPGQLDDNRTIMVSSVTGEIAAHHVLSEADYWVNNLISPVRFAEAMQYLTLAAPKVDGLKLIFNFVEVGPHGALRRYVMDLLGEITTGKNFAYIPILSKYSSPEKTVLEAAGQLFIRGYPVSILASNHQDKQVSPTITVNLPAYPFNHSQIYWHESRLSRDWRLRGTSSTSVLGVCTTDWNPLEPRWRKMLTIEEHPWIADHIVGDVAFFPAAATLMMMLEAVKQLTQEHQVVTGFHIKEAVFISPIVVRSGEKTELLTQLKPLKETHEKSSLRSEVRISAFTDGFWNECFKAIVHTEIQGSQTEVDGGREAQLTAQKLSHDYQQAKKTCNKFISKQDFYKWHHEQGLRYGEAFSLADEIFWDGHELGMAQVKVENMHPFDGIVHPGIFDASCQVCFAAPSEGMLNSLPTIIPHKLHDAWISATGWKYPDTSHIRVFTKSKLKTAVSGIQSSFTLLADNGSPLCHIKRFEMLPVAGNRADIHVERNLLSSVDWKPDLSMLTSNQLSTYCKPNTNTSHDDGMMEYRIRLEKSIRAILYYRITVLEETDMSKAPAYLKKYASWIKDQAHPSPGQVAEETSEKDIYITLEQLRLERPAWGLFIEIAKHIVPIVHGEINAIELLYSESLADDFFNDLYRGFRGPLSRYLELLVHRSPNQKILEVGSNIGSITNYTLSIFKDLQATTGVRALSEYTYAHASSELLERERKRLAENHDILTFKTLDLDLDAVSQGYEWNSYDTIFVSNLFQTKDLAITLRNVRRLLKPGGHLILQENLIPDCFASRFGFGMLPNSWCGEESDHLVADEPGLDALLRECGFTGNDLFITNSLSQEPHNGGIIISTAKDETQPIEQGFRIVFIINDQNESQKGIALSCANGVFKKHQSTVISLPQLAEAQIFTTDYIVYLADICVSLLADISEPIFTIIKNMVDRSNHLLWVTATDIHQDNGMANGHPFSGLKDGFLRTIRSEYASKRIVGFSIEYDGCSMAEEIDKYIAQAFYSAFEPTSDEVEYMVRKGMMYTGRLIEEVSLNKAMIEGRSFARTRQSANRAISAKSAKWAKTTFPATTTVQFSSHTIF